MPSQPTFEEMRRKMEERPHPDLLFFDEDGESGAILMADFPTRGQAKARFAQEIGADFTEIRSVRKGFLRQLTEADATKQYDTIFFPYGLSAGDYVVTNHEHPDRVAYWLCSMFPRTWRSHDG